MRSRIGLARSVLTCAVASALALAAAACGSGSGGDKGGTNSNLPKSYAPPTPPTGLAKFEGATPGSGKGLTVGFIQLDLASPFPQDVQAGMVAQTKIAGLTLLTCDSQLDASKALQCAQNFKTHGIKGAIVFQADASASPRICAALGKVPVIAVDIIQSPCQMAFMGAANEYAGELGGYKLGLYFRQKFDCKYDAFVSLEALQVGLVNQERMGGYRKGFESVCGKIHDLHILDTGGAGGQIAESKMTDTLTALPGAHKIILVGINEDSITGALAAAKAQSRASDLYFSVQNFNPQLCSLYSLPNWVGSVAYFPEKYAQILIPNIIRAMKGQTIPKQLLVPHVWITKDTAKHYYPSFSC